MRNDKVKPPLFWGRNEVGGATHVVLCNNAVPYFIYRSNIFTLVKFAFPYEAKIHPNTFHNNDKVKHPPFWGRNEVGADKILFKVKQKPIPLLFPLCKGDDSHNLP